MGQPSISWIVEQQRAEEALIDRYADLTNVLLRADGYVARAEERAAVVAREPHSNPDACRQEAEDLRRLVRIAEYHLANLDRVHLIEEPARRKRSASREARA